MKTINNSKMREMTARLLTEFSRASENKAVTVFADVNPVNML